VRTTFDVSPDSSACVLFLGVHSVRIVAEPWRTRMRARQRGEGGWKGDLLGAVAGGLRADHLGLRPGAAGAGAAVDADGLARHLAAC
jgi:hypothetical protein